MIDFPPLWMFPPLYYAFYEETEAAAALLRWVLFLVYSLSPSLQYCQYKGNVRRVNCQHKGVSP